MNKVAILLINKFGDKVKPEQIDEIGETALIYAIKHDMNDVAFKIIEKFGHKAKPKNNKNKGYYTVYLWVCKNEIKNMIKNTIKNIKNKIVYIYIYIIHLIYYKYCHNTLNY